MDGRQLDQNALASFKLGYRFEDLSSTGLLAQGGCWNGLFSNPTIVPGYPIPRRQESESGLDVPVDIVAALINAKRLVKFGGTMYLKGFSALLVVTKMAVDTVFWHLVYNDDGSYVSYEDPRVPRWPESAEGLTPDVLEKRRHVVGWCDRVISFAGAADANYSIGWSGLPGPTQSCSFEKITISGGSVITAGVSCDLGRKEKPRSVIFEDDYPGLLRKVADRYFVFYDCDDRRAWLVDGARTLLHLLRASIRNDEEDPRFRSILYSEKTVLKEAKAKGVGAVAACEVLLDIENQGIPLYAKKTETWKEKTFRPSAGPDDIVKEKITYFCVRDRVEQLCHYLLLIASHQDDTHTRSGVAFRLSQTAGRQLEGFDFMDIATGQGTMWPKVATLRTTGEGWVDFSRAIHAPTLFGAGFGDLFVPTAITSSSASSTSCSLCLWNSPLPTGKDYLAVCVAQLNEVLRKKGNKRISPWRLVDDIHWYTPSLTFEPCICKLGSSAKTYDRVQVLLPSSFPKLWGKRSPRTLARDGAVIFGHSAKFPLRWPGRGEPPEEGEPVKASDVESLFHDSGIGTSQDSGGSIPHTPCRGGSASPSRSGGDLKNISDPGMGDDRTGRSTTGLYRMGNQQFIYNETADMSKRKRDEDLEKANIKKAKSRSLRDMSQPSSPQPASPP